MTKWRKIEDVGLTRTREPQREEKCPEYQKTDTTLKKKSRPKGVDSHVTHNRAENSLEGNIVYATRSTLVQGSRGPLGWPQKFLRASTAATVLSTADWIPSNMDS